jgi:hypothetical protein
LSQLLGEIVCAFLPEAVMLPIGMLTPMGLDAHQARTFSLHMFWNVQLFAAAALTVWPQGFCLSQDGGQVVVLAAKLVAFELVTPDEPTEPVIGTVFENALTAAAFTGDTIGVPF